METDNLKVLTLDSLATIKQLIGSGGEGSGITLLDTYTASPEADTTYTAAYVNSRLNASAVGIGVSTSNATGTTSVAIGNQAKATGQGGTALGSYAEATGNYALAMSSSNNASAVTVANSPYSIAIGYTARANATYAIAMGRSSIAGSQSSLAIGNNAQAGQLNTIAIGNSAKATKTNSIALGVNAVTTRNGELSLGTSAAPLYVANVKAGELSTDAVNKKQMEDYVADHTGGGGASTQYTFANTSAQYCRPGSSVSFSISLDDLPTDYNGKHVCGTVSVLFNFLPFTKPAKLFATLDAGGTGNTQFLVITPQKYGEDIYVVPSFTMAVNINNYDQTGTAEPRFILTITPDPEETFEANFLTSTISGVLGVASN